VAGATATPAGLEVRLVGVPPASLAVTPLGATLEDGYLALVGPGALPAEVSASPTGQAAVAGLVGAGGRR